MAEFNVLYNIYNSESVSEESIFINWFRGSIGAYTKSSSLMLSKWKALVENNAASGVGHIAADVSDAEVVADVVVAEVCDDVVFNVAA